MYRFALVAAIFVAATVMNVQAHAVTPKQKMATCKFGADEQKLQGKSRATFMQKCMSNRNDPRGPATGAAEPEK